MSEPNSSAAGVYGAAALIAMTGPLLGPYIIVGILSTFGALVAASKADVKSRREVIVYAARGLVLGAGFSIFLSEMVAMYLGMQPVALLSPVSLLIGLYAHRWDQLIPALLSLPMKLRGKSRE